MEHEKILVITDDSSLGSRLEESLEGRSRDVVLLGGAGAAAGPLPETIAGAIVDLRAGEAALALASGAAARVIACTRRGDAGGLLAALRAGARDHLPLDFTPGELEAALAALEREAAARAAALEYLDAGGNRQRVALRGRSVSLGRDSSNDLSFDEAAVSRFHARIVERDGGHVVIDESSRHGTFVNGARVTEQHLSGGDRLRLGLEGAPAITYIAPQAAGGRAGHREAEAPGQEMKDIMGVLEEAEFEAGSADLAPGDVLLLYSDGITEARGPGREAFGAGRLEAAALAGLHLSAREIHDSVMEGLSRFTREAPLADDATLMVVKYVGSPC